MSTVLCFLMSLKTPGHGFFKIVILKTINFTINIS